MTDEKGDQLDLDYILLTAGLAGSLAAVATIVTLLARPTLLEIGKQLPLPSVQELLAGGV